MNTDRTVLMSARALSPGHEILWYTIDKVLGQGGFGITYLAHDRNLDRSVAIKEYLPTPFAYRHQNVTVKPLTGEHEENYTWGLNSFLKEAQTLAKFGHENIVRVHSVFEENNTAYMVMEYEHGDNLSSIYTSRSGSLDQGFLERTFLPILDGLEQIHQFGFIHRDIKPANIYIREDGTPVLIDFGSARQTSQQETGEMTTLVSKGYTPLEQYSANYGDQGPWTDIYALAASMYQGVTGKKPDDSLSRSACMLRRKPDPVERLTEQVYVGFEQQFLDSMASGLALEPESRPVDLSAWLHEFQHGSSSQTQHPPGRVSEPAATVMRSKPNRNNADAAPANENAAESRRPRATHFNEAADFDEREDFFDDDFVRPAEQRQGPATGRRSGKSAKRSARKNKSGFVLAGLLGLAATGVVAYFLSTQPTVIEPSTFATLNQTPRPAVVVATLLPKEQTMQELGDMLRLGGEYQRAFQVDTPSQTLLDNVDSMYEDVTRYASQWHSSRHADVHGLILRVINSLPERGQRKQGVLSAVQSADALTSFDHVRKLLLAGSIASPDGASVLDEVNRLSKSDYAALVNLPEWQDMMNTLSQSAADSLGRRDFIAAARIVEAGLSLEPDNTSMKKYRTHLSLR